MPRKTTTEKIEKVSETIERLENERKRLINQQKEQERKARTKRLIERGAILESMIYRAETLTNDEIKVFLSKTITSDFALRQMEQIKLRINTTAPVDTVKVSDA